MRLQRGVLVGGVDPELARTIAKVCHDRWSESGVLAHQAKTQTADIEPLLHQLEQAGFLQSRPARFGQPGDLEWNTTLSGGALTMASFLKPIRRAKADALLAGVLERAATYNDDDSKPYRVAQIAAFGSYVRSDVDELGDLDLAVTIEVRHPGADSAENLTAFANDSGRRFGTFLDKLYYAQKDALQTLRAGSRYINLHTEDISQFTDTSQVVFLADPRPSSAR